ncbi:ABC transporter substrate-binding protein [Phreatobacter cathodiphilus]|uniref:ABC transporter substrate-binding protein n=1 Tax=Phreatobacter cathodiphilus TaxID=1868589 RepID=A0A2S0N7L5_9HYPH|nr:ABC transporter substrate-binding protein [Phreatobacter cathodiphilus]AVO44154.1 ABC transporter substrate-binding protein [Phreatobacter cathodiphilus]
MTKRREFILGLGAAVVASGAPQAPALAQARDKVVMSWLPIMQTMAFYVAQEEKLFEKANIEVEAARFQAPNQIIDSLVSARADVGAPGAAAGISVLAESQFPGTFKVFGLQGGGVGVNRINDGLIVANGSSITSFADLKGKTLGHLPGIQWRTISRHMVRKAGLDPDKDVRLVELAVGLQVQAVIAGSADATLSLEPVGSIAVALGEAKRAMTNPVAAVIADPFYSGCSLLTTKFIKDRPAVARRVVEVLDEATRLAETQYEKYRPILPKYTAVRADQAAIVAQPYLRAWRDLNETDLKSYQALVDVFSAEGALKTPMKVQDIILKPSDLA